MVSGSSSSTSGATTRLRHVWCTWRPGRLFHSPSPTRTSTGCTSLRGSRRAASAILHRGRATRGLTRGQASRPCLRGGADRHPKIHFGVLGGAAFSKPGGDDASSFDKTYTGWIACGFVALPLGPGFAIRPELLYAHKGVTGSGEDNTILPSGCRTWRSPCCSTTP